ncbi:hypothetical protein Pmani_020065 [Petrolisthes manimaculis]|uniref:Sodium/nucleoside cotransporter n=1 Tax=Petrolisthes manimaculis TaxID=1843537 RepID=A0AAE1PH23_9EUCA|nr:hypothetical protein Pmani_020065 [Petrolisthes manimaculis]
MDFVNDKRNDGVVTAIDNPAFLTDPDDQKEKSKDAVVKMEENTNLSSDDDDSDDEDHKNCLSLIPKYNALQNKMKWLVQRQSAATSLLVAALYTAYVLTILAIPTDTEILKSLFGNVIKRTILKPINDFSEKIFSHKWVPWTGFGVLVILALVFVIVDSRNELRRLQSLLGFAFLLLFGFVFSAAPTKIKWRHTAWGLSLQFTLGLLILRWPFGQKVFDCAAGKVTTFLDFTNNGSDFVFGELSSEMGIFAFSVLPVVLFFSFCIQILYYWGVMQWVVLKLGWCLQVTIGTTACESINAAANIFLGQTEAPLLIKPYIPLMTKSELHAVMTGGFATVSGSVLAAYINFGVDPVYLISASVMNAPAALAFSKLFYPETKKSKTSVAQLKMEKGDEANWLHAAMVGVTNAIPLVANIAANLISFYAFIALCSHFFDWTCTLVGADEGTCTLENIFGIIFMPLAWLLGVNWCECSLVGELIGLKTIVNEFVAYSRLSEMLEEGLLSKRAETIATYALCGFSNISSIGINLGGFGAMAPSRRGDLAKVVVRAMIAGSCATFLTACIAGVFS